MQQCCTASHSAKPIKPIALPLRHILPLPPSPPQARLEARAATNRRHASLDASDVVPAKGRGHQRSGSVGPIGSETRFPGPAGGPAAGGWPLVWALIDPKQRHVSGREAGDVSMFTSTLLKLKNKDRAGPAAPGGGGGCSARVVPVHVSDVQ